MIYKKCLRILWLVPMILGSLANKGFAQIVMWNPNYTIGTTTGNYAFSYNTTPDPLVELSLPAIGEGNFSFQWEWSQSPTTGFTNDFTLPGAPQLNGGSGQPTLTFSAPLAQTTYFIRQALAGVPILYPINGATYVVNTSNTVKLSVVSLYWQDINYIREHDVLTPGINNFQAIEALPVGPKLQTTVYMDGLDRPLEEVSRQTATPSPQYGNNWQDQVSFHVYDATGSESYKYLPYSTPITSPSNGQYQTDPVDDQAQYMSQNYQDAVGYAHISKEQSPLLRPLNIAGPGTPWLSSSGKTTTYDVNGADGVPILGVDYVQGDAPVVLGYYSSNSLFKNTYTDENGHKVVEYTNVAHQLILSKVQIDPAALNTDAGYACTYYVYDDFGQLAFQIQPEGVKYLDANGWSFAGTTGQTVLAEQCFQYIHDDKGRTIWKKAPGAAPLTMLYDTHDRVNFEQDGNQAAMTTPQWTAHLYDALDRPVITTLYNTTESIASLQTDIVNAATVTTTVNNVTVVGNPISAANMANATVTTILKYLYYDNYSFSTAKSFNTGFTNTSAYSTSDPNVMPIVQTSRTLSLLTGTLTRVLGTSIFLGSTAFYDEKGRQIQTLDDNIKSGTDINTVQYHFDGHILSTCNTHSAPGTDYAAGFTTLTKFIFDNLARVTSIQKQLGANPFKTVANYDFDDRGRVKTKHLDPNYNNPNGSPDLESLNYSFNVRGQTTGINKDYALKTAATYNKWGHFFGMYIGYDNSDHVFNAAQLDGQIGGLLWNTQGDDAQRRYDYTYDDARRLINAAYTEQQHPGDGWGNGQMDFSVSGTSGQITYDYNGNLLTMLQRGVSPGTATPITVDDLRYIYGSYSNKLQSVTDQMPTPTINGQFGDFKDGANAAGTPDYVYDNNGNLVIDLNKNVQSLNNGAPGTNGISYNYLDKPEQIRIVGKGTIKIVYDADGVKLQRVFIPESGAPATITTYIGGFVYQETATLTTSSPAPFSGTSPALSYISFEEGRIRVMTPGSQSGPYDGFAENGNITLLNGKMGAWDYFIRDYQDNIRMILTEETHSAFNTCTMETTGGRPAAEDPVFGQSGAGNEVETTRYLTPAGWQSVNSSASVSRLGNIAGHNIGPNTLQKVMAGDQVTASVQYYFQGSITNSNPNIVPNILSSLAGAIGGNSTAGTLVHGNAPAITSQLNGSTGFINAVQPAGAGGTTPQAFLTIMFFDERFNLIPAADGGIWQQQVASSWTTSTLPLVLSSVKAPKNGYAFVYVSNRSDQDVYFDNLAVGITTGNIIEEDHYYAYGLKIAAISSKKLGDGGEGTLKNNYLYNDKELFDDGDLNWYDYGFRNYDPQIGRFTQLDPLADEFAELTPYQYASCDPIANKDLDGLEAIPTAAIAVGESITNQIGFASSRLMEEAVVVPAQVAAKTSSFWSVAGHFGLGLVHGAWDAVKSVGQIVIHPITTASMLVHVVLNPIQTIKAIGKAIKQTYRDFKNGNGNERADILGQLVFNIAVQVIPGVGEVKDAELAIKGAETVEDVEKVETVVNDVGKVDEASNAEGLDQAPEKFKAESEQASPPKNGETSATARGRAEHTKYKADEVLEGHRKKEFTFENGERADFIDLDNKIIYELKPNNPRQIRLGKAQLERYIKQAEKEFGGKFTGVLDTYK